MDKILVNIYVPVLGSDYDMFIPVKASIGEVLELVKTAVAELSEGRFFADAKTILCKKDDGTILNINLSIYEADIKNGSRLVLI